MLLHMPAVQLKLRSYNNGLGGFAKLLQLCHPCFKDSQNCLCVYDAALFLVSWFLNLEKVGA